MTSRRALAVLASSACLFLAWQRGTPRGEATRARILAIVQDNPGIHKSELARISGLSWGSINHHARILKRAGTLVMDRHRCLVNLYPAGTPAEQMRWIGVLGRPDGPDLVGYIRANPGHGMQSMSQHYNISRKIIRRHLARLEEVGLVVRSDDYHPRFFLRDGTGPPPPHLPRLRVVEGFAGEPADLLQ